jgi:hypothetical protein
VDLDEVLREQALEAAAADIMQLPEIDHEVEALLAKLDAENPFADDLPDDWWAGLGGDDLDDDNHDDGEDDDDDDDDDDDECFFEIESDEAHELLDFAGIRKGTLTDRIRTLLKKRSR